MSEVSNGDTDGNAPFAGMNALRGRAIHIHDEFRYADASAYFTVPAIWDSVTHTQHTNNSRPIGTESDSCILVDVPTANVQITGMGYAIGHFARFVQKGAVRIDAGSTDNLIQISAFKRLGKHSFVLTNNNAVSKTVRVVLSGSDIFAGNLRGEQSYLTNRWLPISAPTIVGGNSFNLTLPANSVTSVESGVGAAPIPAFTKSIVSGSAPVSVDFIDTSTNAPTSWAWNFGDGVTSTLQNPSHLFAANGTYTITLTVTNASGSSQTTQTLTLAAITTLPFGFAPFGLELLAVPDLQSPTNNTNASILTDYSGKNRNLTTDSNFPTFATNAVGGKSVARWNGSQNPLKYTGNFRIACGWMLAKFTGGTTFTDYSGLLTETTDLGILIGNSGTANFYDSFTGIDELFEFRLNDKIYPYTGLNAPMNQYRLIFFRFWRGAGVVGVQIGQDRTFASRKWTGDVAMLALSSRNFCESEVRAQSKRIADYFGLTLADVFPYQAVIKSPMSIRKNVLRSKAISGAQVVRQKQIAKRTWELGFSTRRGFDYDKAEAIWNSHSPNIPIIYRDYSVIPPRDYDVNLPDEIQKVTNSINNVDFAMTIEEV